MVQGYETTHLADRGGLKFRVCKNGESTLSQALRSQNRRPTFSTCIHKCRQKRAIVLAVERQARILDGLRGSRSLSTDDLSKHLDVSAETIRRDLVALEKRGLLSRVHGGAALTTGRSAGEEASFDDRVASGQEGKERIGAAAAALLKPGQNIFIDLGTTALAVARAIPADHTGTIATCSLLAAIELASRPNLEVLISGGRVRRGDLAVSSHIAQEFFAGFYPDVAFLGSGGVDARSGLTDFHLDEVSVRRTVIENASASWVLADHTKLGQVARYKVASLSDLTGIITDADPSDTLRSAVEENGGVIIAS